MTHALIPTGSWSLPVMAPSIGEPVAASTVSAGLQPVTNQLAYLSQSMFTTTGTLDLKGSLTVERNATVLGKITGSYVDVCANYVLVESSGSVMVNAPTVTLSGSSIFVAPTGNAVISVGGSTSIIGPTASIISTGPNVISGTLTSLQGTTRTQGLLDQGYVAVDITGTASSMTLTEAQYKCGIIAIVGNYTGAGINIAMPCAGHSWIKVFDGSAATLNGGSVSIVPVGFPGGGLTGITLNNLKIVCWSDGTNPQKGNLA